jgi:morphogenetic protein associated with SpoVID
MGMMPQGGGMPGMPGMPQQMQQGMPNPYSQAQSREIDENVTEETEEDE